MYVRLAGTSAQVELAAAVSALDQDAAALEPALMAALEAEHTPGLTGPTSETELGGGPEVPGLPDVPGVEPGSGNRRLLQWALAVVQRCAMRGPEGGPALALLPLICALPKVHARLAGIALLYWCAAAVLAESACISLSCTGTNIPMPVNISLFQLRTCEHHTCTADAPRSSPPH